MKALEELELKKRIWKIHDKILELRTTRDLMGLSEREDLELRNLEEKFNIEYHSLKEE